MALNLSSALPSPATPSDATIQSWLSVVRAYNLCDAVLTERLAALDVRIGEHEVLANLLRTPGMTQQQLAARCFVAKSGVSMLVTRMEEQALLRRDADLVDARVKRLSLTKKGTKLAESARKIQIEVVSAMIEKSSDKDIKITGEVMQRATFALEQMLQPQRANGSRD
jgi:DNA-binding MarR family transcriptional regulator